MKWLIVCVCLFFLGCGRQNEETVSAINSQISAPDCVTKCAVGVIYKWPHGEYSIVDQYYHLWYPINLPDDFKISGMNVYAEFYPVKDSGQSREEGWEVMINNIEEIEQ